jgi:hypothetical protein
MNQRVTRRQVLQVGAGLALSAGLARCGLGNGGASGDTQAKIEPKVDGDLV